MKQINLLPANIRTRGSGRLLLPLVILAALLGAGSALGSWYLVSQQVERYTVAPKVSESTTTSVTASSLSAAEIDDTATRVNQLNALSKNELDWERVFASIHAAIPEDIRLTTYAVTTSATGVTVRANAEAPSNQSLLTCYRTLRADPILSQSTLEGYAYSPATGRVNFTLTLQLPLGEVKYATESNAEGR